jgi:hypothetical protein
MLKAGRTLNINILQQQLINNLYHTSGIMCAIKNVKKQHLPINAGAREVK